VLGPVAGPLGLGLGMKVGTILGVGAVVLTRGAARQFWGNMSKRYAARMWVGGRAIAPG